MPPIRILLFDVGGVLVELAGVTAFRQLLPSALDDAEIWRRWLHSPAVRAFETGRCDEAAFAQQLIREFELRTDVDSLLQSFHAWPVGLFPGTAELIRRIPSHYTRALLSNSNAMHWPRVIGEMGLGDLFEHQFVSHLTGKIKPDPEAFQHVVEALACQPAEVFFVDDNQLNIDAALAIGMRGACVRGPVELERALGEAQIW